METMTPKAGGCPLRAGDPAAAEAFEEVRREMVLGGCKWDPQVGDVSTLAPFPLLLARPVWRQLCTWTEELARELMAAETELIARPELHHRLAVPWRIRSVLRGAKGDLPKAPRIVRFDFHPLRGGGWRISEVNSDVPGGFTEASTLPRLMAPFYPGTVPAGDPASTWADTLAKAAGSGGTVALLAAPGFMEDQQIVAFLARLLRERGVQAHLAEPSQLRWRDGRASHRGELDLLLRFYQAEWLPRLPARCGWAHFFAGGKTPVANAGSAVLTESKRFPLVWPDLKTSLLRWRELLPETADPLAVPWRRGDEWLLKRTWSNTGDHVCSRAWMAPKPWARVAWDATLRPGRWVAQRRFETQPIPTPLGERFPCLGIYAIDGVACGVYARLSAGPVVDFAACDAALLLEDESA
jgi:hypothetical protein